MKEKQKTRMAWNKGLTKETDERINRQSNNLKIHYQQNKIWNKGLTKETSINVEKYASKIRGRSKTASHIKKISKKMSGRELSENHKKNISLGLIGHKISQHTKDKIGRKNAIALTGKKQGLQTILKRKKSLAKFFSSPRSITNRLIRSENSKLRWSDPQYKKMVLSKILSIGNRLPNKLEKKMDKILKSTFPSVWNYVGDGQLIINGKCPDFWNGKNKLIEVFGDYWHKNDDPNDRIEFFKQYGYDCLVIWESEVKDKNRIINKVTDFVN